MQWHPDNFQDEEEKKKAEKKFIDIAAAKEVLTDPGRQMYSLSASLLSEKEVSQLGGFSLHLVDQSTFHFPSVSSATLFSVEGTQLIHGPESLINGLYSEVK